MPQTSPPDPRSFDFDAIPETALDWHRTGKRAALATVIQTWGSAPRPVGSQLAVSGDGEIAGSVSGGCVEGAVVAEALEALETGVPRLLSYGVADDDAFSVGLACGGTIRILVEPVGSDISEAILARICAARAERKPLAYVVETLGWDRRLSGPEEFPERFRADKSGFEADESTFVSVFNPPLRLVVVGAVHVAQALMPMARLAGFDATLVDPRDAFGSSMRFPGEKIVGDWPDEALRAHGLDARTAVVTLTHDPKLDDPAIIEALGSDVFYLGCLGSSRTHGKRIERLKAAGMDDAGLARIHAPVGLAIGARTPAEIAVSILAELIEVLRGAG